MHTSVVHTGYRLTPILIQYMVHYTVCIVYGMYCVQYVLCTVCIVYGMYCVRYVLCTVCESTQSVRVCHTYMEIANQY